MTTVDDAGSWLRQNVLRDFDQPRPRGERDRSLSAYRINITSDEAPLPVLLRHALALIGIQHGGPAEKVAWWVWFTYKGHDCELVYQKFGLRLRVSIDSDEGQANAMLREIVRKLTSAVHTVERVLAEGASAQLEAGNVTVMSQQRRLRYAYEYFRERSMNPTKVEDAAEVPKDGLWTSSLLGESAMALHARYDFVAAISAYTSALEHELVLALPFIDFDPVSDSLTEIIGARWGEKWARVVGHRDPEAVKLRERVATVVERWRNPYSHGGFEKGHGATLYLHTPGLGALPVGLSSVRDSPLSGFQFAQLAENEDAFALFDEVDEWLRAKLPHAFEWIESELDVRYDEAFRREVRQCIEEHGDLAPLIGAHSYREDVARNMDY